MENHLKMAILLLNAINIWPKSLLLVIEAIPRTRDQIRSRNDLTKASENPLHWYASDAKAKVTC